MATTRPQKVRDFHKAVRLNPNYTLAMLQLGKAYYDDHESDTAASWLSRVPKNDAAFGEATFLLGMSEFYRGALDRAYNAFNTLAARIPLPEVYNNLGVVEDRRGRNAQAILCFSKVVESDPNDPDYRFNLAVALFKNGNPQGAAAQLKEALQRRSSDGEARSLLDYLSRGGTVQVSSPAGTGTAANSVLPASRPPAPMERVKRNYDEASYRQLELEIHNLQELRLAGGDRRSHAQYHADRGESMLAQGLTEQAEDEFREAIGADYNNAAAHAGLARILEQKGETFNARSEAETSVRIQPSVDALLVLARLNLKQNQLQAASQAVNRALVLEPANQAAQSLQRDIAARQSTVQ
jgi:tetratricopeptide (TPR) repeat protein